MHWACGVSALALVLASLPGTLVFEILGAFHGHVALMVVLALAAIAVPRLELTPAHRGIGVIEAAVRGRGWRAGNPRTRIAAGALLVSSGLIFARVQVQDAGVQMLALFALALVVVLSDAALTVALAVLVAAARLFPGTRPQTRAALESALVTYAGLTASVIIARLVFDFGPTSAHDVFTHWFASLLGMTWAITATAQSPRLRRGVAVRWLALGLRALAWVASAVFLEVALSILNPIAGIGDEIPGVQPAGTLTLAYGVPAAFFAWLAWKAPWIRRRPRPRTGAADRRGRPARPRPPAASPDRSGGRARTRPRRCRGEARA